MQCDESEAFKRRARSLLVVVSTPPTENYENFTKIVREYNAKEPFNFTTPSLFHINNISKVGSPLDVIQKYEDLGNCVVINVTIQNSLLCYLGIE